MRPNLVQFLRENGVKVEDVELTSDQAMEAVRSGQQDMVLLIGEDYGKALQAGESAPLSLVVDTSNSKRHRARIAHGSC